MRRRPSWPLLFCALLAGAPACQGNSKDPRSDFDPISDFPNARMGGGPISDWPHGGVEETEDEPADAPAQTPDTDSSENAGMVDHNDRSPPAVNAGAPSAAAVDAAASDADAGAAESDAHMKQADAGADESDAQADQADAGVAAP